MCINVLLLVAALSSCAGTAASANNVPKIVASAGETVLLPCNITPSGDVPTVEWTREGLPPDIAFLYRQGCETFEMKNPVFQYRTNLIRNELHHGNLSMVISNVQPSDNGKYQCAIRRQEKTVIAILELFVGAVSEPKLSVVPDKGGGLTLQCEAKCWFPQPLITFLDDQGKEISAEDPKRGDESQWCLTVTRRVTLQQGVTCRVHQPEINTTRESEIYIPDECMKSSTRIIISTAVATTFIVFTLICALALFLVIRGYLSVGGQKSSSEKDELIKQLTKELNDLKSRQSPTQQPSQSSNNPRSSPGTSKRDIPPPPKSPYHSKPFKPASSANNNSPVASGQNPARSPQMRRSSHGSSSAVSITNGAASFNPPDSKDKPLPRSTSLSEKRSRNVIAKSPRRNTLSGISNNPYGVLADLSEDENPLIG
ncbi:butyrophilin subfamily 3 member A2-like [Pelmatolapia mariae]|uniref:butyrophilin subfamily 3 member A2-like n=1 Tax=Pelmatolapia mariae TaxID=158779 RepID=UPI002FE59D45